MHHVAQAASPHPSQQFHRQVGKSAPPSYAPVATSYTQQPAPVAYAPQYGSYPGRAAGGAAPNVGEDPQQKAQGASVTVTTQQFEIGVVTQNASIDTAAMRKMGVEMFNANAPVYSADMDAGIPIKTLSPKYLYKHECAHDVVLQQEIAFSGSKMLTGGIEDRQPFEIGVSGEELMDALQGAINSNCRAGINPGEGYSLCHAKTWRIHSVSLTAVSSSHDVDLICITQPFLNRQKVVGGSLCMKRIAAGKSDLLVVGDFKQVNGVEALKAIGRITHMSEIETASVPWPYGTLNGYYGANLSGPENAPWTVLPNSLIATGIYCSLDAQTISYINQYRAMHNQGTFLVTKQHRDKAIAWVKSVALSTSPFHRLEDGIVFIVAPHPCGCSSSDFSEIDKTWRSAENQLETDFSCPRHMGKYTDVISTDSPLQLPRRIEPKVVAISFVFRVDLLVTRTREAQEGFYFAADYPKNTFLTN